MAINFKNSVVASVDASFATMYTCPGSPVKSAVVFGFTIANILSPAAAITVQAQIVKAGSGTIVRIVAPGTPIEIGAALVPAGGIQKIVLEPGDRIEVACSVANAADVAISALEIS
jgi:hypothetical protein